MQAFDIIAIAVTIVFVGIGAKNGFIEEIFHLAALVGGFFGAYLSYPFIYKKLDFLEKASQTKTIIAFVLAYIVIAFSLIVIGWMLKKLVHLTILKWVDRLLGAILGLGKAAIIIFIFVLSVTLMPYSKKKSAYTSSITYKLLTKLPIKLTVPGRKNFKSYIDDIKKSTPVKKLKKSKEKIEKIKDKIDSF